jgi:hypothetical protein
MKASDVPAGFPIPFAANAAGGLIRPIPRASQIGVQDGAASLNDGFVPDNFVPVGAGGVPPFGQDFNGLFNQVTKWNQWSEAGGPIYYDATFSAGIGGYPKGSLLNATSGLGFYWISTADDNPTNPDAAGANWAATFLGDWYAADAGSANHLSVTLSPAPANFAALTGRPIRVKAQFANTLSNPDIAINGMAAAPIVNPSGTSLSPGQIAAGAELTMVSDGVNMQLVAGASPKGSTFASLKSGSGTYATPAGAKRLRIRQSGPGGSSAGSTNGSTGTDGSTGLDTSFGGTVAKAGLPGKAVAGNGAGGLGGAGGATGTGTEIIRLAGGRGGWAFGSGTVGFNTAPSGAGGNGPFGGAGNPVLGTSGAAIAGAPGAPNTGGGASGGSAVGNSFLAGGGGGAGEYVEFVIDGPAATYAWAVGAAGPAGTGTAAGALGGSGVILIEEIY